jgi:hypothetical protein
VGSYGYYLATAELILDVGGFIAVCDFVEYSCLGTARLSFLFILNVNYAVPLQDLREASSQSAVFMLAVGKKQG